MARRRREEHEESGHERWLVSYADFITLLFAFFVVMYAMSSINEGKYRVLSETLNAVFADPDRVDTTLAAAAAAPAVSEPLPELPNIPEPIPISPARATSEPEQEGDMERLRERLAISLDAYARSGLVEITGDGERLELRMKSNAIFQSGSAQLSLTALDLLRDVARVLAPLPNSIQVEGHTDDVPISSVQFPSNWELSAARAASVVHLLARLDINQERLAAVGFGEFRPLAANGTESGRARNRRVSVVVMAPKLVPWAEGPSVPEPIDLRMFKMRSAVAAPDSVGR